MREKSVTTAEARINAHNPGAYTIISSLADQLDAANADNEARQRINRKDQETIDQLRADLARRSSLTTDEIRKELMRWIGDNRNLKIQLAAVTKERDHWKANHDNQVAIKHAVLDRPDLGDQSRSVLALTTQIKTLQSLLDASRQAGAQTQREADSMRDELNAVRSKKPVTMEKTRSRILIAAYEHANDPESTDDVFTAKINAILDDHPDTHTDNLKELGSLLTYAGSIYHRMSGTTSPEWAPCDDLRGMLSQLSNVLRGIHDASSFSDLAEPTFAVRDVLAELQRQIETEGWTAAHDDEQHKGELAQAAACYALPNPECRDVGFVADFSDDIDYRLPVLWPKSWSPHWWKPKNRRYDLVRAGALILAEIERLDRKEQST